MCEAYNSQHATDYMSVMPTNLYGPNDNFDLNNSHVLPALIRKFHEAKMKGEKTVTVWGTGKPKREFLYVEELASACVFLMKKSGYTEIVNIGSGEEVTIRELAECVCEVVGFKGDLVFDVSKPDGMPRKLLDVSRLKTLGWKPMIDLKEGLTLTYDWFLENHCDKELTRSK
jgi:GDP-L-fucose synthase